MSSAPTPPAPKEMRTANLTVVFVTMDDFAERMARLPYHEQASLAAIFEELTIPIARKYGGRKVKTIQDSLLFTFPSPTSALKAAAAMQDRAGRYSGRTPDELSVSLRVGASSGEVRVFAGDVFGEPVNLAARVKALAGAGEVLLTGGIHLSMNRAEIATEPVGRRSFKGVPEQVDVHKLSCVAGSEDTFGGLTLDPLGLPNLDGDDARALASGRLHWRLHRIKRGLGLGSAGSFGRLDDAVSSIRARPWIVGAPLGLIVLAVIAVFAVRGLAGLGEAEPLDADTARSLLPELEERLAQSPGDPAIRADLAHAKARLGSSQEALAHYMEVSKESPRTLGRVHIEDLVELLAILGEATGDAEAALLEIGDAAVPSLAAVWEDEDRARYHRRRAGQVLHSLGEEVDLVPIWIATLKSDRCAARELAARALAELGDPRAIPDLQRASREGCLRGRSAARQSLSTIEERGP